MRTGEYGPAQVFKPPADFDLIGELGLRWGAGPGGLPGRWAVGRWHDVGDFPRLDGQGTRPGTGGAYTVVDATVWRADPTDDMDARRHRLRPVLVGRPPLVAITHAAGGGVTWTGPLPGRESDVLGAAAFYGRFANDTPDVSHAYKLAVEVFYKVQVTPYLSVKPELQYIRHPGGAAGRDDAIVGTVRVQVDF